MTDPLPAKDVTASGGPAAAQVKCSVGCPGWHRPATVLATKAHGTLMARRGLGCDHYRTFSQVELSGLEPTTPCLQSDAYVRPRGADLADRLSVSSREIPPPAPVNDINGTAILEPTGLWGFSGSPQPISP